LSTPVSAWDDTNREHLWAWSRSDVEELLAATGWTPERYVTADGGWYTFGIWTAR
jgi:hypothetical protein